MTCFGCPIASRIVETAPPDAGLDAQGEVQESRGRNGEISGPGLQSQSSHADLSTRPGRGGPKKAPGPPTRPLWGQGKTHHRHRGVRPEATPRGASWAHHPAQGQRRGPRSMVCIWIKVINGWACTSCCASYSRRLRGCLSCPPRRPAPRRPSEPPTRASARGCVRAGVGRGTGKGWA